MRLVDRSSVIHEPAIMCRRLSAMLHQLFINNLELGKWVLGGDRHTPIPQKWVLGHDMALHVKVTLMLTTHPVTSLLKCELRGILKYA